MRKINSLKWEKERILITGHTGFKGSWLSLLLSKYGLNVSGLSLQPEEDQNLFELINLEKIVNKSIISDIRNLESLKKHISSIKPSVVFHLAAQPLVMKSYYSPLETWDTNLMGTLNLLEAIKAEDIYCRVIVVTTDKVYKNTNKSKNFFEHDELGGDDPYSASKAAVEIAVESWRKSFCGDKSHQTKKIKIATARAGNVIGGGDWSKDRLIPDTIKSLVKNKKIKIRNPNSIRPWQHVLEPLFGYISLAEYLGDLKENFEDISFPNSFNFGPFEENQRTVKELIEKLLNYWDGDYFIEKNENFPADSKYLKLSIKKSRDILKWEPKWGFDESIKNTTNWYKKVYLNKVTPYEACLEDINAYFL